MAGWDFRGRYAFDFSHSRLPGRLARGAQIPLLPARRERDGPGVNQCDQNGWWNFWTGNCNGSDRFWRFRIRERIRRNAGRRIRLLPVARVSTERSGAYINDWVCLGGYSSVPLRHAWLRRSQCVSLPGYRYESWQRDCPGPVQRQKVPGRVKTGDCNHANSLNFKGNAASYGGGDNLDSYGFAWAYAPEGAGPSF